MIKNEIIKKVPKVELHDHLSGGLRVHTIIELAQIAELNLPEKDPELLASWFHKGSEQKNLSSYLDSFRITAAVLQTKEALERVAKEAIEDFAEEHVVYAEIRFSPIHHVLKGLSLTEVIESVLSGLRRGKEETGVEFGLILCGMRDMDPAISLKIAQLAVAYRYSGCVGFDIAGKECGFSPRNHIEACAYARQHDFYMTVHAGEEGGLDYIREALHLCGAHRIGHGTRLKEDISFSRTNITHMGKLAHYVRNLRIPIEMCLTSNIGTGAAASYEEHPFNLMYQNDFKVLLCSDNRLMSNTSLTKEMEIAASVFSLALSDLERITIHAMESAFVPHDTKRRIIKEIIEPQYRFYADI